MSAATSSINLSGDYQISADRERVWYYINEPEALKFCISNCQSLTRRSKTDYLARFGISLGPLKVGIDADLKVIPVAVPSCYQLACSVNGRLIGDASGTATVDLDIAAAGITRVFYKAEICSRGRLARYGESLVQQAAHRRLVTFFDRLQLWIEQHD